MTSFWESWEKNRRKGSRRKRITTKEDTTLTLNDKISKAFRLYMDDCEARMKATLKEKSRNNYHQAIYPAADGAHTAKQDAIGLETELGNLSIAEAGQVRWLIDYLADVNDEYPGVAAMHYKVLSAVFTMLKGRGLFDYSPMKLVDPPKNQRALTAPEREELYRVFDGYAGKRQAAQWLKPLTLTLLGTGARTSEGLALCWCDLYELDDTNGIAYIGATIVKNTGKPAHKQPGRKRGGRPVLRDPPPVAHSGSEGLEAGP
ncbi:hypothetical protein [Nocardia heshunensis]